MKRKSLTKQPSAFDFFKRIPDEDAARDYLISARWPDGSITCVHCGHGEVWKINGGRILTCKSCRERFTVRTGTVMAESKISLQKWICAMYLMTVSRKGISSIQLSKEIGITQKSAWFMAHRIRESCQSKGLLSGTIEADETFVGGKEKNKHESKREHKGRGGIGKVIMFGAKSRDGEVRAHVIGSVSGKDLHAAVADVAGHGATLYTDEGRGYQSVPNVQHAVVNHGKGEYINGDVHTNGIESFWAILKRAHMGTFHQWSKKHVFRYANEFVFKANTKGLPAFDATGIDCGITAVRAYVAGMVGRRLTYKT